MFIKELPIWQGTNISPNQGSTDSFELVLNTQVGFLQLKSIKSIERSVSSYSSEKYNFITKPPGFSEYANSLGDIMINRLVKMIGKKECKNTLEIGAGSNHVARILKEKVDIDFIYIVDPTIDNSNNFENIKVFREYYPCNQLKDKKFDLIYSLNTIEHIPNPDKTLMQVRDGLREDGIAIFIFPIVENQFIRGDIGSLLHEHVNYFSFDSAINLFESCGFKIDDLYKTEDNIAIKVSKSKIDDINHSKLKTGDILLPHVNNMQVKVKENKILTEKLLKEGYKIGFHGACNALSNFLYLANLNTNRQYSIFDGDITKRGEYLPFSSIPIKHSSDPTYSEMDYILIAASSFSSAIRQFAKKKIKEENIIDLFT